MSPLEPLCKRLMKLIAQGDVTVFDNADTGIFEAIEKQLQAEKLCIPLDEETRWILGRPNFWCASVANVLRNDGHEIKKKAEEEQAAVIHWMLCLYMEHKEQWRNVAQAESKRIRDKVYGSLSETLAPCPQREQPQ